MTPLLECRKLVCGYGDTAITEPLGLTVEPGQIVSLIGPNGSGKSTILKTVCRLLRPLGGEVRVAGQNLASLPEDEVAQRVALVPQDEAYAFRFTVRQVVAMGRLARSGSFFETPDDDRVVSECLAKADCATLADRAIGEISGGERQRVLIARALAQETELVVMDEPTSHLDVRHVAEFVTLARLLAEDGKGIVLAVHDINVALAVSNRIVLLDKGRIRFEGTPEALIESKEAEAVYGIRFHIHQFDGRFTLAALLP